MSFLPIALVRCYTSILRVTNTNIGRLLAFRTKDDITFNSLFKSSVSCKSSSTITLAHAVSHNLHPDICMVAGSRDKTFHNHRLWELNTQKRLWHFKYLFRTTLNSPKRLSVSDMSVELSIVGLAMGHAISKMSAERQAFSHQSDSRCSVCSSGTEIHCLLMQKKPHGFTLF